MDKMLQRLLYRLYHISTIHTFLLFFPHFVFIHTCIIQHTLYIGHISDVLPAKEILYSLEKEMGSQCHL